MLKLGRQNKKRSPERQWLKDKEGKRLRPNFGSSVYVFFFPPPPGPALYKLGQPRVLSVLSEVLTLVLGPSLVLVLWAFPFLVFQPLPFWTAFSYSNYVTAVLKKHRKRTCLMKCKEFKSCSKLKPLIVITGIDEQNNEIDQKDP